MKKIFSIAILIVVVSSILCGIVAATHEPFGPAPSSGDGVAEGPEFGDDWANDGSPGDAPGPAPGSGDGVSDGPEWP
jgi:hypothetical protein